VHLRSAHLLPYQTSLPPGARGSWLQTLTLTLTIQLLLSPPLPLAKASRVPSKDTLKAQAEAEEPKERKKKDSHFSKRGRRSALLCPLSLQGQGRCRAPYYP